MVDNHKFFGDDAHLTEESLALYVDALRLNKVYLLPGVILGHVGDCEKCKSEIIETFSLIEERAYSEIVPHPYLDAITTPTPIRFLITYRIAAIFLIGISIAVMFFLFRSVRDGRNNLADSTISMHITNPEIRNGQIKDGERVDPKELFADNFSGSPNLENLVNSASRSESPFAVSPKNNAVVSQGILFEWNMQEAGPIHLTILSNREHVLKIVRLRQSKFLFSGKLNPGLYYWKLEREDELLYVGKFFVK